MRVCPVLSRTAMEARPCGEAHPCGEARPCSKALIPPAPGPLLSSWHLDLLTWGSDNLPARAEGWALGRKVPEAAAMVGSSLPFPSGGGPQLSPHRIPRTSVCAEKLLFPADGFAVEAGGSSHKATTSNSRQRSECSRVFMTYPACLFLPQAAGLGSAISQKHTQQRYATEVVCVQRPGGGSLHWPCGVVR